MKVLGPDFFASLSNVASVKFTLNIKEPAKSLMDWQTKRCIRAEKSRFPWIALDKSQVNRNAKSNPKACGCYFCYTDTSNDSQEEKQNSLAIGREICWRDVGQRSEAFSLQFSFPRRNNDSGQDQKTTQYMDPMDRLIQQ